MSTQVTTIPLVSSDELALSQDNALNFEQLSKMTKRTPAKYVRQRPAKGGGTWEYVSGGYVKKMLNIMFGWDWDFEIIEQLIMHKEAIVKGRLTVRSNGKTIIKTQFGNKDIIYRKGTEEPLSIGNDLKAAATDSLKKCASELGIASDVYNKQEFNDIYLVQPLNSTETSQQVEHERIINFINNARTISQLNEVAKLLSNDEQREAYKTKFNTIKLYNHEL